MLIDSGIRDQVLIPLLVFIAVFSLARGYLFRLFAPKPGASTNQTADTRAAAEDELREKNLVARSGRLRAHAGYISSAGAAARKEWLLKEGPDGLKRPFPDAAAASPFGSPGGLAGMQSQMMGQMVQQMTFMGLFQAIQSVLAGFVVVKLPFALTERFKQVTQQGIGVPALDTSFVSSGSFYMIAQTGLPRLMGLLGIGSGVSEADMMQAQMMMPGAGGGAGAPGQAWAPKAAFAGEASALSVARFRSVLAEGERDLLAAAAALPPRRL